MLTLAHSVFSGHLNFPHRAMNSFLATDVLFLDTQNPEAQGLLGSSLNPVLLCWLIAYFSVQK